MRGTTPRWHAPGTDSFPTHQAPSITLGEPVSLERLQFKNISLSDPFFDSLKADYKEFPSWFAKKAEDSAYVFKNEQGFIDGFLYVKIEEVGMDAGAYRGFMPLTHQQFVNVLRRGLTDESLVVHQA
ncbi:hypothetical protein NVS55_34245 [Myxococcus stipitatus]|uniref:hypothetical protein n=1 Tax=Myxococcus stipitatus TaxID=83455 RepID=UPI00314515B3